MRSARLVSSIRTESAPRELALRGKTPFLSLASYYVASHSRFGAFFSATQPGKVDRCCFLRAEMRR